MANRALYYPYIHIRDLGWLKASLLMFSEVHRMTPVPGRQADDSPAIEPFLHQHGGREPMLRSADLWLPRVVAAQEDLARRLREDAGNAAFRAEFGRDATETKRTPGDFGFQIHQAKLHDSLKDALRDTELAWKPMNHEPYDRWEEYVELNERVGQAVMATIGIACAQAEGLDIVGDKRSGSLHDCLVRKQPGEVYNAWLKATSSIGEPRQATARELFEFVISFACDPTDLDAEKLAEMGANREPIHRLMKALADRANNMDPMDPGPKREEQFRDETVRILETWKNDRANLDGFWKRFFGVDVFDTAGKTLEKVISKTLEAAPATAAATTGVLAGLALQGPLLASGVGLVVGLFTHATKTYANMMHTEKNSPYRCLTLMEDAGVVIRADLSHRTPA